MQFIQTTDPEEVVTALAERLRRELAKNKHVLWLVTGGSNVTISVRVMNNLETSLTKYLAVLLTDERYGESGHTDSNARQLMDAGFQTKDAIFVPTLQPGFSLEETAERYAQVCQQAFEHTDIVIAQLGIGADGHIAGILPHSEAVESTGWVTSYPSEPFTRITLTFDALRRITAVYTFMSGENKKPALLQLRDETLSLAEQPAQLLKTLPEAYIYNDQLGEA